MFAFLDLLYNSIIVFIDDFSIQSNAKDHLEYVKETLKRNKKYKFL